MVTALPTLDSRRSHIVVISRTCLDPKAGMTARRTGEELSLSVCQDDGSNRTTWPAGNTTCDREAAIGFAAGSELRVSMRISSRTSAFGLCTVNCVPPFPAWKWSC